MGKSLKSSSFHHDKSNFKFDLYKYGDESYYVEIHQTINGEGISQCLKLKTQAIRDVIEELQDFQKHIFELKRKKPTFNDINQKIEDRYLRGVPIKDLAMQFEKTEEAIKDYLISRDIQIVDHKPPRKNNKRWKRR